MLADDDLMKTRNVFVLYVDVGVLFFFLIEACKHFSISVSQAMAFY